MISEALRLIRVFHDLNQKELAEKLSVSNSYISELESGKKTPTLDLIERYAEVFNMPSSSILFFSENLQEGEKTGKIRNQVSNKVLKILNWIEAKSVN